MKFVKEMVLKNFPELQCLLRLKAWSEKKTDNRTKYMKFQNPGIKGALKPVQEKKKKKKADHIQRIKQPE